MWRLGLRIRGRAVRPLCSSSFSTVSPLSSSPSATRSLLADEGDWSYSSEWWSEGDDGHTVFRSVSEHGNGLVSVVAYPSSRPFPEQWPEIERSMQERYTKLHPESKDDEHLKILGYQWRVLHFNDKTRQSTVKVMAAHRKSDLGSLFLMQQPHILAVPYLKSMASVGLTTLASLGYDICGAATGKRIMKILCVGHGAGSLPLFLASKLRGANIDIVEIDPVVITASVRAMGFPASAIKEGSDELPFNHSPDNRLLCDSIHERLFLHQSDAEDFVLKNSNTYDLVFIDAYDGEDIFPTKLWDQQGPFLESLRKRVHPVHGTVVVNLHGYSDLLSKETNDYFMGHRILPAGRYISQVSKAYKEHFGFTFSVSVPWLYNLTLAACSGSGFDLNGRELDRNVVLNALASKCDLVENALDLPFPCLPYIKKGFILFD